MRCSASLITRETHCMTCHIHIVHGVFINSTVHSTNQHLAVKSIYGHIASGGQKTSFHSLSNWAVSFRTLCASICCLTSTRWRFAFWLIPFSHPEDSCPKHPPHHPRVPHSHLTISQNGSSTALPPHQFATGIGQNENWKAFPPAFL